MCKEQRTAREHVSLSNVCAQEGNEEALCWQLTMRVARISVHCKVRPGRRVVPARGVKAAHWIRVWVQG